MIRKLSTIMLASVLLLAGSTPAQAAGADSDSKVESKTSATESLKAKEAPEKLKQTMLAPTVRIVDAPQLSAAVEFVKSEGEFGVKTQFEKTVETKNSRGITVESKVTYWEITKAPEERIVIKGSKAGVTPAVSEKALELQEERAEALRQEEEQKRLVAEAESRSVPNVAAGGYTTPAENRAFAQSRLAPDQFVCADNLINKESNWRTDAANSSSGAYGLAQSLPGNKMATVADDWQTNGQTQFIWMEGYVANRYGSFCAAWEHSVARNWY